MTALAFLVVIGLVLVAAWLYFANRGRPRARLGPDGTKVKEPETFVVHHEGSPYVRGQRVTDTHRDIETAAELNDGVRIQSLQERKAASVTGGPEDEDEDEAADPDLPNPRPDLTAPQAEEETELEAASGPDNPSASERNESFLYQKKRHMKKPRRARPVHPASGFAGAASTHPVTPMAPMEFSGPLDADPLVTNLDPRAEEAETARWHALIEEIPFPSTYGKDVTIALIRTPRSVYVFWERGGGGEFDLKQRLGEEEYGQTVPVLRVWEGGWPVQSIQVHEQDDHWFLHEGLEPGHNYVFSYERRTPGGLYYRLSQTGPIAMPYDTPGARTPNMLYRYLGGDQPGAVAGSVRR